ncbi:hypothetical protein R3P38DRAFT_2907944, partial [Favolaschia claudopus]
MLLSLQSALRQTQSALNGTRQRLYASQKKLGRDLTRTGCAAGKVESAVRACAEAFGITIRGGFMSRRTVGRVIDEGGTFSELQLAREILNAPGTSELYLNSKN